jgi:transglutaminase-like putative cysteine protease
VLVTPGNVLDPVSVRAQEVLSGDDRTYRVIASVSTADVQSLRTAGLDYPAWATSHYLQLPDTITPRTRELARQIVAEANATNPYDQAQAITEWLRENITYQLGIEPPPGGAEPVDWFLFETRTGFCNYYASAAVVLMRSLGIPARMAVGFTQGQLDRTTGLYLVREFNAHAWPEVYFPNYGWIEFEPTSSEPPLQRPERTVSEDAPTSAGPLQPIPTPDLGRDERGEDDAAADASSTTDWATLLQRWGYNLGIALSITGLLGVAITLGMVRAGLIGLESLGLPGRSLLRWMGRAVPSAVTQAYMELERAARWLGLKLPDSLTPTERAEALSAALPQTRAAIQAITEQYTLEQYAPAPNAANGAAALAAWRSIRLTIWRAGLRAFIRSWMEDDLSRVARRLRAQPQPG